MVYITSWHEFQQAAEELYAKEPTKTRYSVKWKSSIGTLILKITDNTTCIKYKTHSSIILNRFEALNLSLMRKMQNRAAPVAIPIPQQAPTASQPQANTPVETGAAAAAAASSAPSAAAGGVKKKKGKKKK